MVDEMPGVIEAAAMVRRGEVSAHELVATCLARLEAEQGRLNAFVHVDADGALAAADRVDAERRAGAELPPLAGVPFGVKDLEDYTYRFHITALLYFFHEHLTFLTKLPTGKINANYLLFIES